MLMPPSVDIEDGIDLSMTSSHVSAKQQKQSGQSLSHVFNKSFSSPAKSTMSPITSLTVPPGALISQTFNRTSNGFCDVFSCGCDSSGELGLGDLTVVDWEIHQLPAGFKEGRYRVLSPRSIESFINVLMQQVQCGGHHAVGLTQTGSVYVWGLGRHGQLGFDNLKNEPVPVRLSVTSFSLNRAYRIASIACGDFHTLALGMDCCLFSWGSNSFGQLGVMSTSGQAMDDIICQPTVVDALRGSSIVSISAGKQLSAALCRVSNSPEMNVLLSWGSSECGQLGHSHRRHTEDSKIDDSMCVIPSPVTFPPNTLDQQISIEMIACGFGAFMAALSSKGDMYMWGRGNEGQLGLGLFRSRAMSVVNSKREININYQTPAVDNVPQRNAPVLLPNFTNGARIISIAVGRDHTLAADVNGKVYSWGSSSWGQLGLCKAQNSVDTIETIPVEIASLSHQNIIKVYAGLEQSAAITKDGVLYTWGAGFSGQLAITDRFRQVQNKPIQVTNINDVQSLSFGFYHTLVVTQPLPTLDVFMVASHSHWSLASVSEDDSGVSDSLVSSFQNDMKILMNDRLFVDILFIYQSNNGMDSCSWCHSFILAKRAPQLWSKVATIGRQQRVSASGRCLPNNEDSNTSKLAWVCRVDTPGLLGLSVLTIGYVDRLLECIYLGYDGGAVATSIGISNNGISDVAKNLLQCFVIVPYGQIVSANATSLTDVVLKTRDGDRAYCHRAILSTRSKYFYELLTRRGSMSETLSDFVDIGVISLVSLKLFVGYLYSDKTLVEQLENCPIHDLKNDIETVSLEIMIVADRFNLGRLKYSACCILCDYITVENVLKIITHAFDCRCYSLVAWCVAAIRRRYMLIHNQSLFLNLDAKVADCVLSCVDPSLITMDIACHYLNIALRGRQRPVLQSICLSVLKKRMGLSSVSSLLSIATDLSCDELRNECMEYIVQNYDAVCGNDAIRTLGHSLVLELNNKIRLENCLLTNSSSLSTPVCVNCHRSLCTCGMFRSIIGPLCSEICSLCRRKLCRRCLRRGAILLPDRMTIPNVILCKSCFALNQNNSKQSSLINPNNLMMKKGVITYRPSSIDSTEDG